MHLLKCYKKRDLTDKNRAINQKIKKNNQNIDYLIDKKINSLIS